LTPFTAIAYGSRRGARALEHLRGVGVEHQMVSTRSAVHIGGRDFMAVFPMFGNKPIEEIEAAFLPSAKGSARRFDLVGESDHGCKGNGLKRAITHDHQLAARLQRSVHRRASSARHGGCPGPPFGRRRIFLQQRLCNRREGSLLKTNDYELAGGAGL
jgi:hypothetical protein